MLQTSHSANLGGANTYRQDLTTLLWIKRGIWSYFILLIFEGALRKWILPGLATPLLIVRDPLAFGVVFVAWQQGFFRFNSYCHWMIGLTLLSFLLTMLVGHREIVVAIFGARILLIHFPFMFVIGKFFDRNDVLALARISLWITIPMIVLIAMQFYSPQTAWVNRGIGGEGSAGFSGAMGFFRPPGTFSFTNGNSLFWGFIAPFLFYFWLEGSKSIRLLLSIATAALLLSIPLSISRTLIFEILLSALFVASGIFFKPRYLKSFLIAFLGLFVLVALLSQTSIAQTGIEVLSTRFENASASEGGLEGTLLDRFLGGMVSAIFDSDHLPPWGLGLGMGTNAGSMLMSGEVTYLISEGEWGRLIGEMGLLLGLGVILIRVIFTGTISIKAFRKLQQGDILPWLLLSFGFMNVLQAQWAQPTALGFSTLIGGLILASFNEPLPPSAYELIVLDHLESPKEK